MKTWSVFDPKDGLFTGEVIRGNGNALDVNIKSSMRAIEGRYDHRCQRVDIATSLVVDHQPQQPHEDYEWRAENPDAVDRANQRWRWLKKPEVLDAERRNAQAMAKIADIERRQPRILRELALDPTAVGDDGKTPSERLIAIEQEIAAVRSADRPR